ncbi:MAG: Rne/Rng family ribonuclease [Candidatus Omnitrophica bacterium]|nr:Rne/Rng family ribonuclease [Candidatus Omnitrophota bacterium]
MNKEYRMLISNEQFLTRAAIMSGGRVEYLFVSRQDTGACVANIYKGRIERIVTGLNAAFVNIGESRNGFLPFGKDEPLYRMPEPEEAGSKQPQTTRRTGEELIVQAVRPGTSEKGMKLTTKVSIPGRYIILIPDSSLRTLSKKITDRKERERLLNIANKRIFDNTGFIIRTAAEGKNEGYIIRELKILLSIWSKAKRHARMKKAPSLVWKEEPVYINAVRDYVTSDFKQIIVDDERTYREVKRYVNLFLPEMRGKVLLHKERIPLFLKHGLEKEIENFLAKKVSLPSGGSLIIEEGETLNAIDVNSGSSDKSGIRETILNANLEAAEEIPRQIRARNLSGLIVVDFIDMKHQRERRKVFKTLSDNLEIDKAQTKILSISKLGIVEMSREKTDFKLSDLLLEKCERCKGTGYVKNVFFSALKLRNEVLSRIAKNPGRKFTVESSSNIYEFINGNKLLSEMLKKHRIRLREVHAFRESEFKIID